MTLDGSHTRLDSKRVCCLILSRRSLILRAVPVIDAFSGDDVAPTSPFLTPSSPQTDDDHNAVAGPGPSSRFSRYLAALSAKPSRDPNLQFLDSDYDLIPDIAALTHRRTGSNGMSQAASSTSLALLANDHLLFGIENDSNPEANFYSYIETILEALAALGRLGSALETIVQRVSGEIYALVEATLEEVEDR